MHIIIGLIILVALLFFIAAKIYDKTNKEFFVQIGIGLIITEIILVILLMESIINLLTIGSN